MYFFAGHALNAEYVSIDAGGAPEEAIFSAIVDGPQRDGLRNFLPADSTVEGVGETQEKLKLTLSEEFWELPVGERYAAAAQVTFTMAVLEEGKEVFLLEDVVPGPIVDGDGEELQQPLSREDFKDVRPWVEVQQPAAGAVLGKSFPVVAEVRGRATAVVRTPDGLSPPMPLRKGHADMRMLSDGDEPVQGTVVITVSDGGFDHVTEVPVTLLLGQ